MQSGRGAGLPRETEETGKGKIRRGRDEVI